MYEDIDREILAASEVDDYVSPVLFGLCDDIGPRFAGSPSYRRAVDFMMDRLRDAGLENVRDEAFEFEAWRRGAPARLDLADGRSYDCLALPYGASTGPDGVEAELLDVGGGTDEDLASVEDQIGGKIVLVGGGGGPRQNVYTRCAKLGAVAVIYGNTQPGGMLHTGSVAHGREGKLAAASIAFEAHARLQRDLAKGPVSACLLSQGSCETDTTWNVLGELPGTELPDESVVIGGHLDSHDITAGAFDNGCGAVMVMEVARLLATQRGKLKRTMRFIGFAGEECGLLGSHYHAEANSEWLQGCGFMLNCDTPSLGTPHGLAFHKYPAAEAYMAVLSESMGEELLFQERAHRFSDHYPFILQGVPTAGVGGGALESAPNFFVHMEADTPEKIPVDALRAKAAFAARALMRAANDPDWPRERRSDEDLEFWR